MEEQLPAPQEYDFRRHDRIWQRVAPNLTPYPALRQSAAATESELRLPGAEANPCCLGSAAQEDLAVLEGFWREEQQAYCLQRQLVRCAPSPTSRAAMERLCSSTEELMRRLAAVHFLITGRGHEESRQMGGARPRSFLQGLRTAYHLESCGAMNYERAAEGTTDPCLSRIFTQMAQQKYARADGILKLLSHGCV